MPLVLGVVVLFHCLWFSTECSCCSCLVSSMLASRQVPRNVVEDDLRELFQRFGNIVEFEMPQLRLSGQGELDGHRCSW